MYGKFEERKIGTYSHSLNVGRETSKASYRFCSGASPTISMDGCSHSINSPYSMKRYDQMSGTNFQPVKPLRSEQENYAKLHKQITTELPKIFDSYTQRIKGTAELTSLVKIMKIVQNPREQVTILRMLNEALNNISLYEDFYWSKLCRILGVWLDGNVERELDATIAEMLNLNIICLSKLPITQDMVKRMFLGPPIQFLSNRSKVKRIQIKSQNLLANWKRLFPGMKIAPYIPVANRPFPQKNEYDFVPPKIKKLDTCGTEENCMVLKSILKLSKKETKRDRPLRVSWIADNKLVTAKIFREMDEPITAIMTEEEISKYISETESNPLLKVKIFKETRMMEAKKEKEINCRKKETEKFVKKRLEDMDVDCEFTLPKSIEVDIGYALGEESVERMVQERREVQTLAVRYYRTAQIPLFPSEYLFSPAECCEASIIFPSIEISVPLEEQHSEPDKEIWMFLESNIL